MKKLSILVSGLLVNSMVFATALPNGSIALTGGSIAGGQTKGLAISLSKLYPNVLYQVTCTISNSSYKTSPAMITVMYNVPSHAANPKFSLNSTAFTNAVALSQIQEDNAFVATNIANYADPTTPSILNIGNIDTNKSPTLNVSSCIATPTLQAQ